MQHRMRTSLSESPVHKPVLQSSCSRPVTSCKPSLRQKSPVTAAASVGAQGAWLWEAVKQLNPRERQVDDADVSGLSGKKSGKIATEYQWYHDTWHQGFTFNHRETPQGYWLDTVAGTIPEDLEGTFFRNGPGRFNIGEDKYGHHYDGDGVVVSIAMKDQRAFLRSAYVRTPEYDLEMQAQQVLFRGSFNTQPHTPHGSFGANLVFKNTSNTSCALWGDKLLTMSEASVPFQLDPCSLETLGHELLEERLTPGLLISYDSSLINSAIGAVQRMADNNSMLPKELTSAGGDAFTAHTHVDANTGRLCCWSYQIKGNFFGGLNSHFTFWELNSDGSVAASKQYALDGSRLIHDFALTKNYYIMYQPDTNLDTASLLLKQASPLTAMRWNPASPTYIHVIPRPGSEAEKRGEQARKLALNHSTFVYHHCNAYEDVKGDIVVDSVHYDSMPALGLPETQPGLDPNALFTPKLKRVVLDLRSGSVKLDTVWRGSVEMPSINDAVCGTRHQYVYVNHTIFNTASVGVAKVDVQTRHVQSYEPEAQVILQEPCFVPRPNAKSEDDGYLVCMAFDTPAMRSEFWVFDATKLLEGPVARMALRYPVAHGLHCDWTSKYYGPM